MIDPELERVMDHMAAQTDAWAHSVLWDLWETQHHLRSTIALAPDELELARQLYLDPDTTFGTIAAALAAAKAALA